ncbi:MAG: hypothetical protein KAJ14_14465 [Candidatus Omnitrophica bacterium]|nr:hypothetical protein [Candidatus Omnitrophota bacterium]
MKIYIRTYNSFYKGLTPKRLDIGRIFERCAFQIFFSKHFGVAPKGAIL